MILINNRDYNIDQNNRDYDFGHNRAALLNSQDVDKEHLKVSWCLVPEH